MNRIGFSHGKFDILFISGLKTAYWSRVSFFWRQLFLRTNSKFHTPLTLTSHNSGSKHRSIENHHIFRFVRTSAFTSYSPCRVYEIRMSRKCGKHEQIQFFMFLGVPTMKKSWRPAFGQFWCYRTSPWLILTDITHILIWPTDDATLKFWGPRPPQSWKNQICVPKKNMIWGLFLGQNHRFDPFRTYLPPPWYTSLESYGSQPRFGSELSRF